MLLLLLSACSFGITGSPGSISTSSPARCRCGRPGTRWVLHLQPCSQHGSLKSTQPFIPLVLNAKTFPTFNHISALRIFNIPMLEGLAPPAGPPACVKATFCSPGKQKKTIVLSYDSSLTIMTSSHVTCLQPFSSGLVTVMVPQLRRENSLLLWSTLDLNSPVHAFVGHDDVVLEFQWRPQKEGERPRGDSGYQQVRIPAVRTR